MSITPFSIYVLVAVLVVMLFVVLLSRGQKTGKDVSIWFFSSLLGILIGGGGAVAGAYLMGYEIAPPAKVSQGDQGQTQAAQNAQQNPSTGAAGNQGAGRQGGRRGGRGGGGFGGGPSPKRQLTSLVRKLDLLTGDIQVQLSEEQIGKLKSLLGDLKTSETMTDEDAQKQFDALLALLDEGQKAKTDAIGLPINFGGRGGRGGRGGGGRGGRGGRGGGGGGQDENANPFTQQANADAIKALQERFGE